MGEDVYITIRMWAPATETSNPRTPYFVRLLDPEDGGVQWTVTTVFDEAHLFKTKKAAQRVLRGVKRIASRIERGWIYEIVRVSEEITDTNRAPPETEIA